MMGWFTRGLTHGAAQANGGGPPGSPGRRVSDFTAIRYCAQALKPALHDVALPAGGQRHAQESSGHGELAGAFPYQDSSAVLVVQATVDPDAAGGLRR